MGEQCCLLLLHILDEEWRYLVPEQGLVVGPDLSLHLRVQVVVELLVPYLEERSAGRGDGDSVTGTVQLTEQTAQMTGGEAGRRRQGHTYIHRRELGRINCVTSEDSRHRGRKAVEAKRQDSPLTGQRTENLQNSAQDAHGRSGIRTSAIGHQAKDSEIRASHFTESPLNHTSSPGDKK